MENAFFSNCFPSATSSSSGSNTVATTLGGKLYFGTAADNYELNDPAYTAKLNNESLFGQITPRSLRWDATESVQGFFTFDDGDAMVALAQKNGQLVRGPPCVVYNELPNWVNSVNIATGDFQNILNAHCSALIKHFAVVSLWIFNSEAIDWMTATDAWDVFSEPISDDGSIRPVGYSPSGQGVSFIESVLYAARGADPDAKVYVTSSNMDTPGPVLDSMLNEVQHWLAEGVPIDGIGFRSHFTVGGVPSKETLIANYETFTALGIEVAITELDIRGADILQQQTDYQTVISACKAVAGCVGVTLSDFTDKYSSVPAEFGGSGMALPWDYNFIPKPAYDGIIAGFTN
ncbi:Endo-1,4-beta-xylanase A precursor [Mycena venus]|uniref:Beta-xylanase n=1 Tax=Mycena venus TaxID=2733690 RepID=A0A8H6XC84_9AGAR|nr:Endo-1,4-beta-xylanase A precursor [Mycena venus]